MEYMATGEGFTEEVNFCYANNKKEAKQKHLDKCYPNDPDAAAYYGVGVTVMEFNTDKARQLCNRLFANGELLWMHMKGAGREMHFKIHYNHG